MVKRFFLGFSFPGHSLESMSSSRSLVFWGRGRVEKQCLLSEDPEAVGWIRMTFRQTQVADTLVLQNIDELFWLPSPSVTVDKENPRVVTRARTGGGALLSECWSEGEEEVACPSRDFSRFMWIRSKGILRSMPY